MRSNISAAKSPRNIYHITTFKDRDRWLELLFAADDLSPGAKVVGGRIALHHNVETGQCNPAIGRLVLGTGISDSGVRRAIREMEIGGWLRVDRTLGRHSNSYEISGANPVREREGSTLSMVTVLKAPTLSVVTGFKMCQPRQPCQR